MSLGLSILWICHLIIISFLAILPAHSSIFSISSGQSGSSQALKYVALVTRHGSRSPLSTFPNDQYPYTDPKFWPGGPEGLTNLGKVQMYHTGQYLRKRYDGFLNRMYFVNESDITYNPYNRDYMSAALISAGLYPPVGRQIWNPSLLWQPVIQSLRSYDICDLAENTDCPKYAQLYKSQFDKFNEDTDKYADLLQYVSTNAGKNYTMLTQMYDVYDTLLMETQNGYKLAQWTKKIFPSTIRPIAVKFLIEMYAGTEEQIKLAAGPELKFLADKFNKKANGTLNSQQKLFAEAAHDCTLIVLLRALGNRDPNLEIQTGGYLLFELHYINPNYIVKAFYYKTSYDTSPDTINITGCPNPCSLQDFNKFVDSVNPPDWNQACRT